jgi:ABC-type polysaccharide/polyol phosphate export permease
LKKNILVHNSHLALSLGWQDVKQAYRRSVLGPFWLTIGISLQILTIGLVFGMIFRSPLEIFLPYLAVSLILWSFISSSIADGAMAFISSEAVIRQLPIPHWVFVLRSLWKNLVIAAHNIIILPIVLLFFMRFPGWDLLLFVPGLTITVLFLFSLSYLLGIITTRFRDMQQILSSLLAVMFYVTPVIWQPGLVPAGTAHLLLGLNPLYHFLQIIRLPILGEAPTSENWALAMLVTALAGSAAYFAAKRNSSRIAYWV